MPRQLSMILLVCVCCCSACGAAGGGPGPLVCEAGFVALRGTVDGRARDGRWALASGNDHFLDNETCQPNCLLNIYPDDGGRLHFEWPAPLAQNQPGAALGQASLGSSAGFSLGNCRSDGEASELILEPAGVRFTLRLLREDPFCDSPVLEGELEGCAAF